MSSVRRYWWLVLVLLLAGALAGIGVSRLSPVLYKATASVSVTEPNFATVTGVASGGTSAAYVATQVGVMQSAAVMSKASEQAGVSQHMLEQSATIEQRGTSNIIDIATSAGTPTGAQRMAQSLAAVYLAKNSSASVLATSARSLTSRLQDLTTQILQAPNARAATALQEQYTLAAQQLSQVQLAIQLGSASGSSLISGATVPWSPVSRHGLLYVAAGVFAGLAVGVIASLLLSLRFPLCRTARQVEDMLGIPVAVDLPRPKGSRGSGPSVDLEKCGPAFADQFDALTALVAGATDDCEFGPQQVAVTCLERGVVTAPLTEALRARFASAPGRDPEAVLPVRTRAEKQGATLMIAEEDPRSDPVRTELVAGVVFDDLGRLLDRPDTVMAARTADVVIVLVALPLRDGQLLQTTVGSTLHQHKGTVLVVTTRGSKVTTS